MNTITLRLGDMILDNMTGKEVVIYGFWNGIDPVANGARYTLHSYGMLWEKSDGRDIKEAQRQQRQFMKFDLDRWFNEDNHQLPPEALVKKRIGYRERFLTESISFEPGNAATYMADRN
jgi:hypothetical protein